MYEEAAAGAVAGFTAISDLLTALPPRPGRADTHGIDVDTLLAGIDGGTAPVLVCGEGAWPDPDGAARLRAAGGASILVLRSEAVNLADLERFDLVVGVGPAAIAQEVLVRALPRGVMGRGLVESAFLDALRTMPVRPGAVVVGSAGDPLALAPDGVGAPDVLTPRGAAEADVSEFLVALRRGDPDNGVPALSAVVYRAERTVTAWRLAGRPTTTPSISCPWRA